MSAACINDALDVDVVFAIVALGVVIVPVAVDNVSASDLAAVSAASIDDVIDVDVVFFIDLLVTVVVYGGE